MRRSSWRKLISPLIAVVALGLGLGGPLSQSVVHASTNANDPLVYVVRDVTDFQTCKATLTRNIGTSAETTVTMPCPAGTHWAQLTVRRSQATARGERYLLVPQADSTPSTWASVQQQIDAIKTANQEALQKQNQTTSLKSGIRPLTLACNGSNASYAVLDTDAWDHNIKWNVSIRWSRDYSCAYWMNSSVHNYYSGTGIRYWLKDKYAGTVYHLPTPPSCSNTVGSGKNYSWSPNANITPGYTWEQVLTNPEINQGMYCTNAPEEWDDLPVSA